LGRPALLATTDEFLRHFGLASLDDLPELAEDLIEINDGEHRTEEEEEML
jgi:segregation and condensation protein B